MKCEALPGHLQISHSLLRRNNKIMLQYYVIYVTQELSAEKISKGDDKITDSYLSFKELEMVTQLSNNSYIVSRKNKLQMHEMTHAYLYLRIN